MNEDRNKGSEHKGVGEQQKRRDDQQQGGGMGKDHQQHRQAGDQNRQQGGSSERSDTGKAGEPGKRSDQDIDRDSDR